MEVPRGFTRCDECEGKGSHLDRWKRWVKLGPGLRCPSCSGSGLLPTEKLREEIHAIVDPFMVHPLEVDDCADAVLRKVAETLGGRDV